MTNIDKLIDDLWSIYDSNGDGVLKKKEYDNFVKDFCAKGTDFEGAEE